tara:strand:+ start:154 stop:1134 length:981 start_codon:yes stop_codon:yes gene_type:complete
MAIAPVNKFISVAVPVAPGLQKLYEVPTGVSSLLLYAQVANVGIGTTYPTVTLIQRRESRSTKNTRDVRVIKDVEIPPNDAVILVDGRLVLEKTPLVLDRVYIESTQQNVGIINNVDYDEPSGIATVTTASPHSFDVGDPICLSGIKFNCTGSTGITTTVFPDPQQSFMVDTIVDNVGTSKTFSTIVGTSKGYPHVYNRAEHFYVRSRYRSIEQITGPAPGTKYTPDFVTYDPDNGNLVVTVANTLQNGNTIRITDNSLFFTCTMDNRGTEHSYPRSTDPASGANLTVTGAAANSFTVNVGVSSAGGYVAPLQMEFIASILENSTT